MRAFRLMCAGFLLVAVVQALPAEKKLGRVELEKDAEEIPLPDLPQDPIIFDGFLGGISDLFERMRQQMLYLMSHVPRIGLGTPEGGNTTSVTKVIDGHKVTINETVYTSGDGDDAAAVFKVRVVDIHPDSSEEGSEEAPRRGSVESVEISRENEIPTGGKQQKRKVNSMDNLEDETNYNDLETMDEPNSLAPFDEPDNLETFDEYPGNIETFDEDVEDRINNEIDETEKDLSNDIRINSIAAQRRKPQNPDAEIIPGVEPPRDLSRDIVVNDIARNEGWQPHPDVEVFDPSKPFQSHNVFNLARDTIINEIGNLPINPDAEFIHPDPRNRYYYRTE